MKEASIHKNHRQRMKEIFLSNGFAGFSEVQKLEFLLFFAIPQKDTNPIAHALLEEFGSLHKVLCADYNHLIKVKGVGNHVAMMLKTFRAVCMEQNFANGKIKLENSDMAKAYCFQLLNRADVEEFYVICMDNANRIIKTTKLGRGSANKVHIEIRDITNEALKHNAPKIIVAHNHPSGQLMFSNDDIHFTHSILCSCLLNALELTDHILVTSENALSMYDTRHLEELNNIALNALDIKRKIKIDPNCPYEQYISSHPAKETPKVDL